MNSKKKRLIVFTRYPEAGRTKTRLIPVLGPEGAADLQRRMTERILETARQVAEAKPVVIDIYYCGGDAQSMQNWLGPDCRYHRQMEGGLDIRMGAAFKDAFTAGTEAAIIVGSDIPDITAAILNQAFEHLDTFDLVLGPATDGGYYLIGLNQRSFPRALPKLMNGIDWGSDTVLARTLQAADDAGLTYRLLPQLSDVDRPQDLTAWQRGLPS